MRAVTVNPGSGAQRMSKTCPNRSSTPDRFSSGEVSVRVYDLPTTVGMITPVRGDDGPAAPFGPDLARWKEAVPAPEQVPKGEIRQPPRGHLYAEWSGT